MKFLTNLMIPILMMTVFLTSCSGGKSFNGRWGRLIGNKQIEEIEIYVNGSNHIVKLGSRKMVATMENQTLKIEDIGTALSVDQSSGTLLFSGKEYFRIPEVSPDVCACLHLDIYQKWNVEPCKEELQQHGSFDIVGECEDVFSSIEQNGYSHKVQGGGIWKNDQGFVYIKKSTYRKYVQPYEELEKSIRRAR